MEKENIMIYLQATFNINAMSYLLIDTLYDYINAKWCGKVKKTIDNKSYVINAYLNEFIEQLNNCNIDVTLKELIENNIIDYYNK